MMLFAQSFLDFGFTEGVLHIVRVIAAVGGAVVGWFVADPLTRVAYRVSFKGATPWLLLLASKLTGATTLSLLIYWFLPLGGGGGYGYGPGAGGRPGKGPGDGGNKNVATNGKDAKLAAKDKIDADNKSPKTIESVEIEIISRDDDDGSERYFLLKRAKPALTVGELEEYFKKNHARIEVTPVLTRTSIGVSQADNPRDQLLRLTEKYKIKTLQTKTPN